MHTNIVLVNLLALIHFAQDLTHGQLFRFLQLGKHLVPQLVLQSFNINLLPDCEWIKNYLLIQAPCCVKSFGLLGLKHVFEVLHLFYV